MDLTFRQEFLVLNVVLPVLVLSQDCIFEECFCPGTSILCQDLYLTSIPKMLPTNTQYTNLVLNMNEITAIQGGSLPPNLTEINFQQNPISVVEDTAFDSSANTLQSLTFSSAIFERIPDAFLHLKALKSLTIFDSKINDWNLEVIKSIDKTVTTLDLQTVGMVSWPIWIQYFSHLTQLTIVQDSISSIPDDAFDNVTNSLLTLSLYQNSLTQVPKAISKLKALQTLYLNDNKIIDVTWLPQQNILSSLYLSNNQISDANLLSHTLRPYADSLSGLDIHLNLLTSTPDFQFLTQITTLDFSFNKISNPFSGSVPPTLTYIEMSHNSLTGIPIFMSTLQAITQLSLPVNAIRAIHGTDFPPLTMRVDLGNNLISELTDTSFPEFSDIQSVDLSHNPLGRISIMAFKNLHNLTDLNLQNTRLTRLPLALRSLLSLSIFDISETTGLVCTCMEKDLEQLFLSLSPGNIFGTCGMMSIYDFFSKLSSDCPSQLNIDA